MKATIRLEQLKQSFTKSEQKIYHYIISHTEQVLYHSLTELAEACNVGEATVLRLFRKMGYKGFQEFKFALAMEMNANTGENEDDSYIFKVKRNMITAIENSYDVVDEEELQEALTILDGSSDIVIFGVGSSSMAALDMQNRLLRIGKNVQVFTDPHFQIMRTASMNKDTVVVAISLTGSTKDIVDSVAAARERAVKVISITNYSRSPLTKLSDCILLSSAKENPLDSGSLVSKVAQLFVIDLICTGLTIRNFELAKQSKMAISEDLTGKLY